MHKMLLVKFCTAAIWHSKKTNTFFNCYTTSFLIHLRKKIDREKVALKTYHLPEAAFKPTTVGLPVTCLNHLEKASHG
jgi:hypothetical protein